MDTQQHLVRVVIVHCGACEIQFGMPHHFYLDRLEDHKAWYCPNGHRRCYAGPSDTEKALQRVTRLERQLANREEDLRAERASHRVTERRRAAAKGQLTKTKNRIAAGTCPCCKRNFVDLGRHMAGQHPDYTEASTS